MPPCTVLIVWCLIAGLVTTADGFNCNQKYKFRERDPARIIIRDKTFQVEHYAPCRTEFRALVLNSGLWYAPAADDNQPRRNQSYETSEESDWYNRAPYFNCSYEQQLRSSREWKIRLNCSVTTNQNELIYEIRENRKAAVVCQGDWWGVWQEGNFTYHPQGGGMSSTDMYWLRGGLISRTSSGLWTRAKDTLNRVEQQQHVEIINRNKKKENMTCIVQNVVYVHNSGSTDQTIQGLMEQTIQGLTDNIIQGLTDQSIQGLTEQSIQGLSDRKEL